MSESKYISRENFLTEIFSKGIKKYPQLKKHIPANKRSKPVKDFELIVSLVEHAEEQEIIYTKATREDALANRRTQVRWYLGQLQRKGKIKGFLRKKRGRPPENKLDKYIKKIKEL